MEVEINSTRGALVQNDHMFDKRPLEQRQAINDMRGHVAELLAKAVRQGALDQEITVRDRERMIAFLRGFGDLGADYRYTGSTRAGVSRFAGAADAEDESRPPLALGALLDGGFWQGLLLEERLDMQAVMLQPIGGMDRIAFAFARRLGGLVKYGCPVTEIRKTPAGVRVVYAEGEGRRTKAVEASYCVCALPPMLLAATANDLSQRVKASIAPLSYAPAYKIAWQSRRFWEQENNIYGGISWLANGPISIASGSVLANVWYPSDRLLSDQGVLIAGYAQDTGEFGALPSVAARFEASRAAVEKLHPGRGGELKKPIYVAWGKVPFSLGSWARSGDDYYQGPYRVLLEPDERIYFAGDHLSHLSSWQEGAVLSAQRAVTMIASHVRASRV